MRDQTLLAHAKSMRRAATAPEQRLWFALRAKRFAAAKFRRQVVIGRFIVDFACRSPAMVVVEIDGDTHATTDSYDADRTRQLEARGYRVIRFTNDEVMNNIDGVLLALEQFLNSPPLPALSPEGEREKGTQCPKC